MNPKIANVCDNSHSDEAKAAAPSSEDSSENGAKQGI